MLHRCFTPKKIKNFDKIYKISVLYQRLHYEKTQEITGKKTKMHSATGNYLKIVVAVILGAVLITGASALAQPIQVTDSKGTRHIFKVPPQRVISLVPSVTEILFEIGAGNAVIGLTYHDATLTGAQDKKLVGGFFQPAIQKIISLDPDLVILADFHKEIIPVLENARLKVFIHDTQSVEQSFETIATLGTLFGKQGPAGRVVEKNRQQINHIRKKLTKAMPERKRVIRLMGRKNVMTPGSDSFQNELIRLAGGIPPDFGKKGSVVEVTKEEWIQFNPQVVYGCGGDKTAAEAFFSRPGWDQVDAVKNHQIFYFPCELTCRAATHSGYFVQWLSSMIYTDDFAKLENDILPKKIISSTPVRVDLDYVESASVNTATIYDFENKTLMVDFKQPVTIVSTLEGQRDNILTVGNHYSPPPTWGPGHKMGIDHIRDSILEANNKDPQTTSFLITGANMDNLSVHSKQFKDMKVVALVTAGVMSNAMRMSKDVGHYYEPGTINIIIMTNMELSPRAMTRAIISATEAKTAALDDMDIRSTPTPLAHEATGTGTDNVLVVQGDGVPIKNAGGHTKMGELIAKAVYAGVNEAVLKQNQITANRHIFQRLKERNISLFSLISKVNCDCMSQNNISSGDLSRKVEHLLLEKKYSGFIETALAISDEYEKGLVKDLTLFDTFCRTTASQIAGRPVEYIQNYLGDKDIPTVLKTALNTLVSGSLAAMDKD